MNDQTAAGPAPAAPVFDLARRGLALVAVVAAAGCSAIPPGRPAPAELPGGPAEPLPLRLAVPPPTIALSAAEEAKGYRRAEVLETDELGADLAAWAAAAGVAASVHPVPGERLEAQLDAAWEARDDLLLQVHLADFESAFEGHNGWWIPNLVNWAIWMVPAWFVATEDYSLGFRAEVSVRSVDSNRVLHRGELDVEVEGSFDEFDRGWQFFGFIFPNNDEDNWRQIVGALLPAATSALGAAVAEELQGPLLARMRRADTEERMRKTLALVVGVSRYHDAVALPPLPYAADDARAVAAALTDADAGAGLAARQVQLLVGGDATAAEIERAVGEIADRARPNDQTVFYFAGYGVRRADGAPALILNAPDGSVELPLERLGELLAPIPGAKLVVLDCSFDGRGRSVAREAPAPAEEAPDAGLLAEALGGAALLAARPGDALQAPEHLAGGLFSHHLAAGLGGAADLDENGAITPGELLDYARQRTVAEAAYYGVEQRPVLAGQADVALPVAGRDGPAEGEAETP